MKTMGKRTRGAWIITHSMKLRTVNTDGQFSTIEAAGKYGRLLSVMSASDESTLSRRRLSALAKANSVDPVFELDALIAKMAERHLVSTTEDGSVALLGITHGTVLERTADLYDSMATETAEDAVLGMAERVSEAPVRSREITEELSDTFKLTKNHAQDLLGLAENIGFVDAEELGEEGDKLYFNGNIFRVKDPTKTIRVLESLNSDEQRKVNELQDFIMKSGFATLQHAEKVLGRKLFEKLQAIALFDVSSVANDKEEVLYVSRPASFAKYGNPWEEDTLDYAKALVASLAYGMTRRSSSHGRIKMLERLVAKLARGEWLNENTAAGQDYRYLELKNVVETKPGRREGLFNLRLLKREVGLVALEVLTQGSEASESVLERLPASPAYKYTGPEANRVHLRKRRKVDAPSRTIANMLEAVRQGRV